MSYVEQHLLPKETVAFKTTLHWKLYFWPVVLTVVVFIPLLVLALGSQSKAIALAPLAVIGLLFGGAYLQRRSSEYAVTNKRVIVKSGVLQTRSLELLLGKVEGITVNQGLGGKLLGYGEIVITGTGGTKEPFSGIQSPFEFRRAVQAATEPGAS